MPVCAACGKHNPDEARFCLACGAKLEEAPERGEVRKTVTVLFADVTGSTALGERLDPESTRRVMARWFEQARTVLERHGASVEKFIGDAVMAVFGIPVVHEDDALRAVRAATEMRQALAALNDELERDYGVRLEIRTGVNTGEVVAGEGQTLATGDAVNVGARLEQAAQPGEILIGETTYRLVRDAVEVERVEPLELKGKAETVSAFRLDRVVEGAEPFARRLDAPLVGRTKELGLLTQAFDRAASERACHLATVLGEPGLGKSRLARELISAVEGRATVLVGRCLPYGEGITYWPLREVVRQAAGAENPAAVRRLLDGEDDADLIADRVTSAIGLSEREGAGEETFWAARKLLEALARDRALVVVFEDIHWAEPTFLDLIEYVLGWSADAPLLLVTLARPELLEQRAGWPAGTASILLEPLSDDEAQTLIDNLLEQAALSDEQRAAIVGAAEGNPLFVEQMLAMLAEGGRSNGQLALPPTIQALLAARLDRLSADERSVVERASVVGKEFWRGAVADLSPEPVRSTVGTHLMALVRKEFIRPDRGTVFPREDAFRFRHILIRDAAYAGIPKELRSELHARFASWLERQPGDYDEIVGYHLEQAYRYREQLGPLDQRAVDLGERAADRLSAAGRRALVRGDMAAAANLLDRATALMPTHDRRWLELVLDLGIALGETGDFERADALLVEAIGAAAERGDRRLKARASVERHLMRIMSERDLAEARRAAEQALPLLEELGDDIGLARAYHLLAHVHWFGDVPEFGATEEMLERALVHARRAEDEREEVELMRFIAGSALWGPMPVPDALRRCQEILKRVKGRRRTTETGCLMRIAGLRAMQGRFDEARQLISEARRIMREVGLTYLMAHSTDVAAMVEMLAADPAAAERELRASYEELEQMGEHGFLVEQAWLLARALYAQDRYAEADGFLNIVEEAGIQEEWGATRAKLLARRGRFDEAESLARENVERVSATDAPNQRGAALMDLAEVLRLAGQPERAAPVVEEAGRMFERKGNLVSAAQARALLEELDAVLS